LRKSSIAQTHCYIAAVAAATDLL